MEGAMSGHRGAICDVALTALERPLSHVAGCAAAACETRTSAAFFARTEDAEKLEAINKEMYAAAEAA